MAAAHLDAHRAGAAVPARARGGPRVRRTAAEHRRGQGRQLEGRAHHADPGLRPARAVPRLRLRVVLRDLHPADGLAGRLRGAPAADLLAGAAGPAAPGAEPAVPAARVPHLRARRGAGRGPRAGADGAAPAPLPGGPARRGRRRGEGLPARGRQPAVPPLGPGGPGRLRVRPAVRLQGRRDHHRRPGLQQHPEPVRRLRARLALQPLGPVPAELLRRRLPREVADQRPGDGPAGVLRRERHLPHQPGRGAEEARPGGQPPAEHRGHRRVPGRPRLRARGDGARRPGQGRLPGPGGVPAAGQHVPLLRRDQGPRRRAAAARLRGAVPADLRLHPRRGPVLAVPRRPRPGAVPGAVPRRPRPRQRQAAVGLHAGRSPPGSRPSPTPTRRSARSSGSSSRWGRP